MAITAIPNQPINLTPYIPDECNLADNKAYCALYNKSDNVYLQMMNETCYDELFCNPDFSNEGATQVAVVNPQFLTDLSGWIAGVLWAWDPSGGANFNGIGGDPTTDTLSQIISGVPLGVSITLSLRFKNVVNGIVNASFGSGSTGVNIYAFNGNATTTLVHGGSGDGNLAFSGVGVGNFTITDIYITTVINCLTSDGDWTIGIGGACKTLGSTDALRALGVFITTSFPGYFKIKIRIENQTAGTLSVIGLANMAVHGGTATVNILANGFYELYGEANNGGNLVFSPSDDFNGCLTYLSIIELPMGANIYIIDQNMTIISDVTGNAVYWKDRISLFNGLSDFDDGCYRFQVIDPCSIQNSYVEQFADTGFDDPSAWTVVTDHPIASITGSAFQQSASSSTITHSVASQGFSPPTGMQQIKITFTTGTVGDAVQVGVYGGDGSTQTPFYELYPMGNTTYSVVFNTTLDLSLIELGVRITSSGAAGVTQVLSASFQTTDLNSAVQLISNCFSVTEKQDCAKLVQGFGDSSTGEAGFLWLNSTFALSHRVRFLSFNPEYPTDGSDYEYSNGDRNLTYAKREKYYIGLIDYSDETLHDTVSAQLICQYFTIDGINFLIKPTDYKPEWDKDGRQSLAQARISCRKVSGTIYSR